MLVIEHTSNGQRVVKIKKDWHPGRMGSSYTPRLKNYVDGINMERLQRALLSRPVGRFIP